MKFVTNLKLGILGKPDDPKVWREILSTRTMVRACKKAKRILVVAGGHGTEVDVLVELHGKDILTKIWFNELLVCFTNDILIRYPQINIAKGDFMSLKFVDDQGKNMKFDVIVGNPPFQESKSDGDRKDQASNLWSIFWKKSFDLLDNNPNGMIALITPTSWLSPSADFKSKESSVVSHNGVIRNRLWEAFNDYTTVANVSSVAQHFPGVGSSFGYAIVDKSSNNGLSFTCGSSTVLGFLPKSNLQFVLSRVDKVNNIGNSYTANQDYNDSNIRVSIPMTRALTNNSIEIIQGNSIPTAGSDKLELYQYIHVNDINQAIHIQNIIIDAIPMLSDYCRWSGFLNGQIVKMLKI